MLISLSVGGISVCLPERDKMQLGSYWSWVAMGSFVPQIWKRGCYLCYSMPSQKRIGQCRVSSSKAFCPVQQASKRLKISRMDMSTQMRDPPFVPRSIVRTSCISSFRRYSSMSINSVVVAYTTAWYQPRTQACTGECWKGNGNTQYVRIRPIGRG